MSNLTVEADKKHQDEKASGWCIRAVTSQFRSTTYLAVWYAVSTALQLRLDSQLWSSGIAWWRLWASWLPGVCLAVAFAASAAIAVVIPPADRWWRALLIIGSTIAVYGLVFLGFVIFRTHYSRIITLAMFVFAILTVSAPHLLGTSLWQRASALCALIALVVAGPVLFDVSEAWTHSGSLMRTEYYNLEVGIYSGPKSRVRGGALARIGDRYLLLTGDGHLYSFVLDEQENRPDFVPLPYHVPLNGEDARPWVDSHVLATGDEGGGADEVLKTENFRAYGLLVQETGSDVRIFASHVYWNVTGECWVERVSMLEANVEALLHGVARADWRTLYDTKPCLPIHGSHRRHGIPFVGYFGGGRMQLLDPQTLLLTVGDFGFDGVASVDATAQDPASSYGKTIAINIADGRASVFTLGHRNPQGLYIDRSGNIWSTEHGPQGGDKLNRLKRGGNYGWPYETYGTDYGSFSWPLEKPESDWRAEGYQDPLFAWVPSIGVSNLLVVERDLFPRWHGDLLIGSLKERTLFRVHLRENQVAYVESILIGSPIRDLIEGYDGRIVLLTGDQNVIALRPKEATTGEALVATKCTGCHQTSLNMGNGIGPNLSGVLGRPIASLAAYGDYSSCLRHLGGVWTETHLDAFLKKPSAICPGTSMDFAGVANDAERAAIIQYLGTRTN